jgi:hypothetical protein
MPGALWQVPARRLQRWVGAHTLTESAAHGNAVAGPVRKFSTLAAMLARTMPAETNTVRRKLARTLLEKRLRNAKLFADIDGLKAALIANAAKGGNGFREVFEKGQITVACPKAKECKGDLPEVDPAAFAALPASRREKLIEDGIVKLVPSWSREFYGRVDIKLFG